MSVTRVVHAPSFFVPRPSPPIVCQAAPTKHRWCDARSPRQFAHTFWVHANPTAPVAWELNPTDEGCLLVLTHSLDMDDVHSAAKTMGLGDDITTMLARNGAGWHRPLDRLEAQLDDRAAAWSQESQRELQRRYAALLAC